MNLSRAYTVILICLVTFGFAVAQSPRRRTTVSPAATKPSPDAAKATGPNAQPSPSQPAEATPATVAVVNDVTISASDIEDQVGAIVLRDPDPYLRAFYVDRDKEIKDSRQRALEARVNSLLIAAEAKKRGKIFRRRSQLSEKRCPYTDVTASLVRSAPRPSSE